jgi:hypothetical protein
MSVMGHKRPNEDQINKTASAASADIHGRPNGGRTDSPPGNNDDLFSSDLNAQWRRA